MIDAMQSLMDQYLTWLKEQTTWRLVDDWIEITTPYLDRHNDYLQIYARQHDAGYLLTDGGEVLADLQQSGCKLDSPKRRALLQMTLRGFGVREHQGALEIDATVENFASCHHALIQAMLAVNDLFYLAVPMVTSLFYEDVIGWLDVSEIRYIQDVKLTGKTGYDHLFDFVIPKSRQQPERIVQTMNRPSREYAQSLTFAWLDTKEVRSPDSRAYAFLNDTDQAVPTGTLDALRSYDVHPVLWSKREEVRVELAA